MLVDEPRRFGWAICILAPIANSLSRIEPRGCFGYTHRRETGRFNGETIWEFLKMFREASVEPNRRIVAISDNAQYHRSRLHLDWRQQQAPHFGLDFLPPYSPELNPIGRVWKLTRRLCLHNRYVAFLDSVADAVEGRFAEWTNPNDALNGADAQLLIDKTLCLATRDSRQKIYFKANWITRGFTLVVVICPNAPDDRSGTELSKNPPVLFGLLNCAWLNALKNSARNCTVCRSVIRVDFNAEMSQLN